MEKIYSFTDSLTRIKHNLYELDNGIKIFHAINPSSIEYVLTVAVRAGSSFENMNNVPHGTAHFLEHIISGNPNKLFQSRFEIDEFESGTREDPEIFSNASTSKKYMYFYAYGNQDGTPRINQRIKSIIDYPEENISKYIEKERGIILAEQSHMNKKEFDKYLQFSKFLYNNQENGFTHTIIGEKADIKKVSSENIIKFYKNQFTSENVIITIQSGTDLLKTEKEDIIEIGKIFQSSGQKRECPSAKFDNTKRIHHFSDNQVEGVSLALLFTLDYKNTLDYNSEVLEYLFRSLMRKISHDYLRERLNLIYSSQISNNFSLGFKERIVGYEIVMQPNNLPNVLNALDSIIESKIESFLKSKEGKVWFESAISSYIFPRNMPYQINYAERKGLALLEDAEVLELDKAVNSALKINITDVLEFCMNFFSKPPLFWIESDSEGDEYTRFVEDSKLYNGF